MRSGFRPVVRTFTEDVLELLRNFRVDTLIPTRTYARSIAIDGTHKKVDVADEPDLKRMPREFHEAILQMPSFRPVWSNVRSHPNAPNILIDAGRNPLPTGSEPAWLWGSYLMPFISDLVGTEFDLSLESNRFASMFARLKASFEATEIRSIVILPLLKFEGPKVVRITDHVSIRQVNDAERRLMWQLGAIRGSLSWSVITDFRQCIAARWVLPKSGEMAPSTTVFDQEAALTALCLLRRGDAISPCSLSYVAWPPYSSFGSTSLSYSRTYDGQGEILHLETADGKELRRLTHVLSGRERSSSPVETALGRYLAGRARGSFEDRFIDIWIALEALFSPSDGEVTHRIAQRAAYYIAKTKSDRERIYRELTDSYSIRSGVVHGRRMHEIGRSKGKRSALEVAQGTEDHLRRALRKAVSEDAWDSAALDGKILRGE